ncbi:MAG: polymerase subunit sigma-70 [Gammaproteobacteria bacterium]|nr:polymerase subunit sigma-70 [Gammaproteobacteria bacterium]
MRQPDNSELQAVASIARKPDASSRDKLPKASDRSDRILITAIAQRDQAAFSELHLRYRRRIARFVSVNLPRCKAAEEITNDTLWIVWQSAGQFKGTSKVSTWIMGIAYHVGLKSLRKSAHRLTGHKTLHDVGEATHNPWSQSDTREWVAAGLARLPEEQRTVLELAYHLGHSCAEIAETMNCPVSTVKTRMHYGRMKLKLLLPSLAGLSQRHRHNSSRVPGLADPPV